MNFGADTVAEHEAIEAVFKRLAELELPVSWKKVKLFQEEREVLGHMCGRAGRRIAPGKAQALADWPMPTKREELRSFLFFAQYLREEVHSRFRSAEAPLQRFLAAKVPFTFRDDQTARAAFRDAAARELDINIT